MHHLVDFVNQVIRTLGYGGVFLWMALESACIPIPSEAIMPFAGVQAAKGLFNLHLLAFTGALGNLAGSVAAYWVGAVGGRRFVEKYGKYVLMRRHDLDLADHWFAKHGDATVFFTRMMPVVRTFISLPAGIARMPFAKFCIYTFAGALPWCYLLTWAGIKLGEHMDVLNRYFHQADIAVGVLILAGIGWWIWRHTRPEPEGVASSTPESA